MLQWLYTYVCNSFTCFSGVFASVSYACFKCFISLHTYVANVASGCFKSRSGVASPCSPSAVSPRCLLLSFCYLASFSDREGGARRRSVEVRAGDGNVDMSTCSSHFCNRQEYDFRRTLIFFIRIH
jgi:hypothetical protein